jgi:GTPase SAR1 family protein
MLLVGLKRPNLMEMQKCALSLSVINAIWKLSTVFLLSFSRKVSYEEGAKFAKDNDLVFMEVSAKTAYQVEDSFKKNAELLLNKIEKGTINVKNDPPGIKMGNAVEKPS